MPGILHYEPHNRNSLLPFTASKYDDKKRGYKFTYKSNKDSENFIDCLGIGICPDVFSKINKDVIRKTNRSLKANLREIDKTPDDGSWYPTFMDGIPSLKIMERAQNSRTQEICNLFQAFAHGWDIGKTIAERGESGIFQKLTKLFKAFAEKVFTLDGDSMWISNIRQFRNIDKGDDDKYVIGLTYKLYYELIGGRTLNYYELPFDMRQHETRVDSIGWRDDADFGLVGDVGTASMLGKFLKFAGAQYAIALQPRWDPKDTAPQSVRITFPLFNDTREHAVNNFKFINTIMPGAMSMQYGLTKQAPNVYDVQVEGVTRMYMCACDVSIRYKGNCRIPSQKVIQEIINGSVVPNIPDALTKGYFRIPDIYEVTLNFRSLLPNNLNNYLFWYMQTNDDIMTHQKTEGIFDGFTSNKIQGVVDGIKNFIEDPKEDPQKVGDKLGNDFLTAMKSEND